MTFDAARLAAVISPLRRALLAAAREREALPDIPDAQIEVIRALPRGTVTSPSDLARSLGLNRSTISNLLAAMERSGLVARRPRADDRRHVEVVASADALGYFERFDAASAAIVSRAASALTPAELAALDAAVPVLERLRDVLVEQRRDAASVIEEA
jgi:DNA-binding MarR family transcriptional regulator